MRKHRIAGDITRDESIIAELSERLVLLLEFEEFRRLHEHDGAGRGGQMNPVVEEEMDFKSFVHGVRMGFMAIAGNGNSTRSEKVMEGRWDVVRVKLKRFPERCSDGIKERSRNGVTMNSGGKRLEDFFDSGASKNKRSGPRILRDWLDNRGRGDDALGLRKARKDFLFERGANAKSCGLRRNDRLGR